GLTAREKRRLVGFLAPYETGKRGSGDPSRWSAGRELEWSALRSELVVEIDFDHVSAGRIRHGARLRRWRDDKDPRECTFEQIVRRHRMIERFLTDVLGVPWDEAHEEAERLEHAMSPVLEERMQAAIAGAETCPHGHPIVARARPAGVPLADVEVGACVRVLRFENEAEELLHYLKAAGLEPGLEGSVLAS